MGRVNGGFDASFCIERLDQGNNIGFATCTSGTDTGGIRQGIQGFQAVTIPLAEPGFTGPATGAKNGIV